MSSVKFVNQSFQLEGFFSDEEKTIHEPPQHSNEMLEFGDERLLQTEA
jgi:hypothetical protein